ncbi:MAG: rhomboid family intramembrane serine protease [Candidatus Rokubacteria bacterium]|nr:rhomboid family intramembrane serine protease [Candidatus Rokubacteria bacterium]MBI2553307.1 rhomboid family intramembrane serine protease [Candidatus Rokubacteria bacterium]
MLPLKDDIPTRTVPFVTVGLIASNILVFLYQASLQLGDDPVASRAAQAFIFEFGLIPCRLTGACEVPADFPHPVATIFTSMFMHGGFFHVFGNMLYLWIFGNNVEDTLGHGRFLGFYLASGVAAALGQTLVGPSSATPMIGASGAVSGVLGAYLVLFPYASVLTLIVFGFFIRIVRIPALFVLGFWIIVQFLNGLITFGASVAGQGPEGGVAWFAHIGGFLAGIVLLYALRPRHPYRLQ